MNKKNGSDKSMYCTKKGEFLWCRKKERKYSAVIRVKYRTSKEIRLPDFAFCVFVLVLVFQNCCTTNSSLIVTSTEIFCICMGIIQTAAKIEAIDVGA